MLEYCFVENQKLLITDDVLEYMQTYQQRKFWHREAGGQLFAHLNSSTITVVDITGPRRTDRRGRWTYTPDRKAENAEILDRYEKDLHFIGDWHTHPENYPMPSSVDVKTMADCVLKSKHQLRGFFLFIVGAELLPNGLNVSFHDGKTIQILRPNV
jgi:integrative and conjugative element protein (TIGR02256 family)